MKFTISRTSRKELPEESYLIQEDEFYPEYGIEISSLEELLEFVKNNNEQIVIQTFQVTPHIEIYDDYRE